MSKPFFVELIHFETVTLVRKLEKASYQIPTLSKLTRFLFNNIRHQYEQVLIIPVQTVRIATTIQVALLHI